MSPWLITTTSWPAATAVLVRALAGAAADPLTSTGAAMALLLLGGAVLLGLRSRARRSRRSTS
ncbi:MAG: hypothetical protein ACLPYY_08760 [Acidimicrobiales bacterium]